MPVRERERQQNEAERDEAGTAALSSVSSGGSAASGPASGPLRAAPPPAPGVQPPLEQRHQHGVQRGDGEQAVGEHGEHRVQAEWRANAHTAG